MLRAFAAKQECDVVVIGGGASGMMAAATAAECGAKVLLLEKNPTLGKKLSITGGGRCNVTNNKPDVRTMLDMYKTEGKFLFSTFTQHGVKESIEWFGERKVPFIEENEGRLFPETQSALTIKDTLQTECQKHRVDIQSGVSVLSVLEKAEGFQVQTSSKSVIEAKCCILATGGYARPETGSTGDGFKWLTNLGHTVVENDNALVPLTLASEWTKVLSGLTLPEVKITIYAYEKRQSVHSGRMLFTHVGVTGPLILNMSKEVADLHAHTEVQLLLDIYPQFDAGGLKEHLKEVLDSNKKLQNALAEEIPLQLVRGILGQLKIDGETPCHSIRKEERIALLNYLKRIPLPVSGLLGSDKAVISSGGVALEEIDFKTMQSRKTPNLFIIGDLLNINRPSGGYSLQLCWSTGYVAGVHAAKYLQNDKNVV